MPFINADRVKETTTTTGTGPLTLAGAVVGFRSFLLAPMATNDTCSYAIVSATGLESEAGIGTFTSPNILTRTTVQSSSNGNAAVNFSAGVKDVFIGPIAGTQVPYDPVTGTLGLGVNALNDVAITAPTVNQVLKYSGTEWTNQADAVNVGTVTIVSVASANGFGGTVATDTTTPAITLTTSITGLLKGNASALLAAVAGTDYVTPTGSAANLTNFPTLNQSTTGNAATVTTNANLTGHITSVGNAAALGSFTSAQLYTAVTDRTGTGGAAVFADSPTLVTPFSNTLSAVPIASGAGNSLILSAGNGSGVGAGGNVETKPGTQGSSGGNGRNYWRTSASNNTQPNSNVVAYSAEGLYGGNTFNIGPDESNWATGASTHTYFETPLSVQNKSTSSSKQFTAAFFTKNTNRTAVLLASSLTEAHVSAAYGAGNSPIDLVFSSIHSSYIENLRLKATGETQVTGFLTAPYVRTTSVTVAALPAAAAAGAGARAFVSDATLTTFATIPIGGGANGVPVYSDGTNWRIG